MKRLLVLALLAVGCGDDGGGPDAGPMIDAREPGGTVSVTWSLTDGVGPIACADVGATTVEIRAIPQSGATPASPDSFACSSLMGTTKKLDPGGHTIRVRVNNFDGQMLGEEVVFSAVNVVDMQDTAAGAASFTVSRTGGFTLLIDSNASGPNCDPVAPGAGITGMSLQLRDGAGNCVPSTELGTVCPPATGPCIENDAPVGATGLTAGDYTLEVFGYEGVEPCYHSTSQFQVSGGDLVTDVPTLTLPLDVDNVNCTPP